MDNPPDSPKNVDPQLLNQFLQNQTLELQIKQAELGIKHQEIENSHEFGKLALHVQLQDRKDERAMLLRNNRNGTIVFIIFVALLFGFTGYALYLNKEQIVLEIIKATILLLSGGIGGYSLGKLQSKRDNGKTPEK